MEEKENKKVIKKSRKQKVKKNPMQELEQQAGEYLAGWQRAKADYENLQKESAEQRQEYVKFANANMILELLPVLDNFKSAFNSVPEEEKDNAWMIGLGHIKKQMEDFMTQQGVETVKTEGEAFDATKHEAVDSEVDDDKDEDTVLREVKAGYTLNDKVIQVAKVVVSKKK